MLQLAKSARGRQPPVGQTKRKLACAGGRLGEAGSSGVCREMGWQALGGSPPRFRPLRRWQAVPLHGDCLLAKRVRPPEGRLFSTDAAARRQPSQGCQSRGAGPSARLTAVLVPAQTSGFSPSASTSSGVACLVKATSPGGVGRQRRVREGRVGGGCWALRAERHGYTTCTQSKQQQRAEPIMLPLNTESGRAQQGPLRSEASATHRHPQ
jgi:hypothetical protein